MLMDIMIFKIIKNKKTFERRYFPPFQGFTKHIEYSGYLN